MENKIIDVVFRIKDDKVVAFFPDTYSDILDDVLMLNEDWDFTLEDGEQIDILPHANYSQYESFLREIVDEYKDKGHEFNVLHKYSFDKSNPLNL